jgi:hypothetical protein
VKRGTVIWLVIGAVILAVGIAAIGVLELTTSNGTYKVPTGDALLNLDGVAAAANAGEAVNVSLGSGPEQHFQGTTGCSSQHFVGYYGGAPNAPMLLVIGKTRATLAYGSDVYRFDEGAQVQNKLLLWQGDLGPSGTFSHIIVQVNCPPL